ncbi:Mediator of RNA polymerase II transcription subunit 27 [Trichinella zimbabwensis]|uniref:Mediator of RNA polymerase II transcription subunit 27 n=1 Tax=Trichinella zimbabwensis TaxID=268475 RepID=A0A0V1HRR7_9BILA|nr:Mediator of RNA polymerase II transcription subunit 27 [Trichinella zimbabwensis]
MYKPESPDIKFTIAEVNKSARRSKSIGQYHTTLNNTFCRSCGDTTLISVSKDDLSFSGELFCSESAEFLTLLCHILGTSISTKSHLKVDQELYSSTVSVPIELAEVTVMQGLRAVRDLRQAMSRLFDTLKDVRETPVTDEKAEESDLWLNFKSTLQKIMDNFEILEKCAVSLSKQPVQFLHPNLNQQIRSYCTDEAQIYPDIVYVYEWMKRIRESAQWLYNFVSQMSRRSQSRCLRKVFLPVFLQVNLTWVSFNVQTSAVDALRGPCTIFKVAILLRGLQIEWANVKGPEELNQNCLEKADIYKPSQYIVFQKMTENVKCMIAQFNSSYSNLQLPQTLIRQFFNWLHYYRNIYSEPCIYCKKILKDNLPSCIREFRETKVIAFHESCR